MPTPWSGLVLGGTGGTGLVLAEAACCGNLGGTEVPIDPVDVATGCAAIPSVELGTTGFMTRVPVSEGATSAVSAMWGAVNAFGSEPVVPGGLDLDSGWVVSTKSWESQVVRASCWDLLGLSESDP